MKLFWFLLRITYIRRNNMNTQKIMSAIIVGLMGLTLVCPVYASSARVEINQEINVSSNNKKVDISETRIKINGIEKEFKNELKVKIASRVADVKKFFTGFAILKQAKVTAKTGTSLIVESDGKTYAVNLLDKTKLRRRFFGKATTDEVQVGHIVNVYGKWTDENHTIIDGILVRDVSIQLRFGVFVGVLKAISGNIWTLDTASRGTQTVTVSSDTKFYNRKNEVITQGKVQVNDRIRVKGLWDRVNSAITEVRHVKVYTSLVENP